MFRFPLHRFAAAAILAACLGCSTAGQPPATVITNTVQVAATPPAAPPVALPNRDGALKFIVFGDFGTRGVGYDIAPLVRSLVEVLHLDRIHRIVIFGMGNIGTALARYPAFNSASFRVVAGFDHDPDKIGKRIGPVLIHPPSEVGRVVRRARATMAVLAVPGEAAHAGFDALAQAGITAILNFSPFLLASTGSCRIKNVDLRTHLEELAYFGQA